MFKVIFCLMTLFALFPAGSLLAQDANCQAQWNYCVQICNKNHRGSDDCMITCNMALNNCNQNARNQQQQDNRNRRREMRREKWEQDRAQQEQWMRQNQPPPPPPGN